MKSHTLVTGLQLLSSSGLVLAAPPTWNTWPSWPNWPTPTAAAAQCVTPSATVSTSTYSYTPTATATGLPVVDLGYQVQQADSYNATGDYYSFSNIRYAAPPVGDLRWRAPVAPAVNRSSVVSGAGLSIVCPQSLPSWIELAEGSTGWISYYLEGKTQPYTPANYTALNDSVTWANAPTNTGTEDCLFLDVLTPASVFEAKASTLAPVIVWIYGGGYVAGSKEADQGLLYRGKALGDEFVYVTLNYRLGAFGWLAGPTLQSDGVANAALYDQQFALQWVQANIHLFGGDKNRVTVIGESAGAGSIMHQITAYGGLIGAPFQQAIMQSPAWQQETSHYQLELQYESLLAIANVTTLSELRGLTTAQLQAANYISVWQSPYGTFQYGPSVDGTFVPDLPGKLLLQGNYVHDLNIMVGHNSDEGLLFVNPFINTEAEYQAYLASFFTSASEAVIQYIATVLYPPVFDGTYPWHDWVSLIATTIAESQGFACNTYYFDRAFNNQTHAYLFAVPPGLHGEDTPYTFYNDGALASSTVLNTTVADILQDWIVTFASTGVPSAPNYPAVPTFPEWGSAGTVEVLNVTSVLLQKDPADNSRCAWWQLALFE